MQFVYLGEKNKQNLYLGHYWNITMDFSRLILLFRSFLSIQSSFEFKIMFRCKALKVKGQTPK